MIGFAILSCKHTQGLYQYAAHGERRSVPSAVLKVFSTKMKDHRQERNMSSGRLSKGRWSTYEQEMDHAFTLIFHNIKRLQDGVLSKSDSSLAENSNQEKLETKTNVSISTKFPVRKRSESAPYLEFVNGAQNGGLPQALSQEHKSGSFHDVSDVGRSPTSGRRVRFADDYATEKKSTIRTHRLSPLASQAIFPNRRILHDYKPSDLEKECESTVKSR